MTRTLPLRRIVVGVNGSAASVAAVRWAVREARLRHANVHLVCAYDGDAMLLAPYASASRGTRRHERRAAGRTVLDLATELASRRLPPERLIAELVNESPARALLDRAVEAEMLILGVTRPGEPAQALGPVARTCLHRANCPVVVVTSDGPRGKRRSETGWRRRASIVLCAWLVISGW